MVNAWSRFLFRQLATALVVVTSILLLSEILLPSSILPYFNLHILVLATLIIASISPRIEEKSRWRMFLVIPLAGLLLLYAWLMFGMSASGLMLLAALATLLIGLIIALVRREPVDSIPTETEIRLSQETVIIEGDTVEIIEEETSVFMR